LISFLTSAASILLLVYLAAMAFFWFAADGMIFQPHRSSYRDGAPGMLKLRAADGTRLSALYLPNAAATYTVLFSHGNAEDLGDDAPFLEELRRNGFAVLAYDYPGYGTSEGKPTEARAYAAADAAYAYLTHELHVPPERIILHGRSLGGAVAVDLASRVPAAGLVLESTLTSASRVGLGFRPFVFDRFASIGKMGRVRMPLLVMHGERDGVIPIAHGRRLFALANEPKRALWVPGAGHNDLAAAAGPRYWAALRDFGTSLAARTGRR
jgi:fermentation-respiration switch protein FrsA (DUF1100 family)